MIRESIFTNLHNVTRTKVTQHVICEVLEVHVADINVKGINAKPDVLNATLPGEGDVISKLQRYLIGKRGLSSKRAAKVLADAIDDFLEEEFSSPDEADSILGQLRNAGVNGRSPKEIAKFLAEAIESGSGRGRARLEKLLREKVQQRLNEAEAEAEG
ncbi:MAG: hypothetical protein A2289_13670 [Deltaproteobacteria bacterium RIFOXYA12_FULL_58_15]|nr:MAG: hypothetical protein A2289_13670 [Deltaproteobacteria bacterium RIFOXYA12_FULL_58_15]OGR09659.1 MAG: hypothetical protein A2341_14790 [Deltaproteobacteria bacterium RIFOXYB12_FULL_58_9]